VPKEKVQTEQPNPACKNPGVANHCVLWIPVLACALAAQTPDLFQAVDLDSALAPATLLRQLAAKRVVFVGETHDRYDHHLNQAAIIRGLYQTDPKLAIGVEYLEQRFQPKVDDYIYGRISEQEFLRETDYFEEWGYDYRLYQPIFQFARENKIPVRALNVPSALVSAVSKKGLAGLTPQERSSLPPDMQPADDDYKARLRPIFEQHGSSKPQDFDHFVDAQLTWDESMSASAAVYLDANPERRMVILAGSGHLAFGSGIPKRLERRTHASYSIVLNAGSDENIGPHVADYLLVSQKLELPPAGMLGITTENKDGECRIRSSQRDGLKRGDVVLEIDGQPVKRTADVKLALWNKKPGDQVSVTVRHHGRTRTLEFDLKAAPPT
jgi:uncharacterized iron-regulated protein